MAEIRLTTEQQQVVDARDCNLLVAAAAGSGKTAVLVRRIIKKVLDKEHPQDIDRLLIVTFTNAAAAEMRERIGAAIEEALMEQPENKHLQRQMLLLHNAQITTIHSFCLSVIREFFHVLKIDPGFRIGDEAELSLMRTDVFEQVLEECYEEENADFLCFVESFAGVGKDQQVIEYGKKLYDLSISQLWPEEWLIGLMDKFEFVPEKETEHPMFTDIMEQVKETLANCGLLVDRMLAVCDEPDGPAIYREAIGSDEELVRTLTAKTASYQKFAQSIRELSFARLPTKKQEAAEEKKQLVKDLRDVFKKLLKGIEEDYFYAPAEELLEDIHSMAPAMRGLSLFTRKFMERYAKTKQEKNLIDFSDLEQMALRILVTKDGDSYAPTREAGVLAARFDEIMIDEYQDSNRIQEAVLGSVSGIWTDRPNVFMVGDVKQSIYRFRMACPDLFMEKYRTYQEEGAYRKIDLHKNFRSRACVLEAINSLFAGLMHADSTEVEYDDAAALYYGADYPEETEEFQTEVLFVSAEEKAAMKTVGENPSDAGEASRVATVEAAEERTNEELPVQAEPDELSAEEKNLVRAEALAVAMRMKELKRQGVMVGGRDRQHPVEYKDMVILLRTMSGWSEQFLEVLSEQGIPAYADTSSGYFKSLEIRKTLEFLRILDNPKQDIPFAAVLHSPIAGLNAKELADLRIRYGRCDGEEKKQLSLYTATRKAAEAEPSGKAAKFLTLYDRLAEEAQYISIHELIEHFYRYSGFLDIVTVMPGGERRRGNLEMLVTKAMQYESTSFSGLYDFIRYMDKLIKYEVDFGEAQIADGGNMVRIMSIHKSKGLEFPVVFLCGMEKKFNFQDMRKRLVFHSEYGLGPDYVNTELRTKAPTLLKRIIVARMNEEMISEELRVLYVAMTRAKEKLILVGSMKNPGKRLEAWKMRAATVGNAGQLSSYVKKSTTYFDFVCPLIFAGDAVDRETYQVTRTVNGVTFSGVFCCKEVSGTDVTEQQIVNLFDREERLRVLRAMREEEAVEEQAEDGAGEAIPTSDMSEAGEHVMSDIREMLRRQETYSYAFEKEAKLPVKVTVSELKRLHLEEMEETGVDTQVQMVAMCGEDTPEAEDIAFTKGVESVSAGKSADNAACDIAHEDSYPEFLQEKKEISGSDRGTLYHHVMELLPMERELTKEDITDYLDGLVSDGKLRKEEREAVFDRKIFLFTQSELGKRMHTAKKNGVLYTEQPFVIGLPACEIYPECESRELVLVQGIMDAFFEEEDGLVLMDYKTDYVHSDAKTELTAKYQVQLDYYRRALEQLTGKNVKEVWIYSFYAGEGFRLDMSELDA